MYVAGPTMTSVESVTPLERLLPRGAANAYDTVTKGRPPVLTIHRLAFGFVTSSGVPSDAVAVNADT